MQWRRLETAPPLLRQEEELEERERYQGRSRAEQRRERRLEAEEYLPPVQVEMSRTSPWRKRRWRRLFLGAGAVLLVLGAMEVVVLQAVEEEVLPAAAVVVLPVAAGAAGRLAVEKANQRGYQDRRRGLTRPSWRWELCKGFLNRLPNGTAALISLDTQRSELHRALPTNLTDRAD
jgi:hypothetical protein